MLAPVRVFAMKNKPQKPALWAAAASKLRSRRGYTLSELLVTLALISFFSVIAVVVTSYAARMTKIIITRSRACSVSDTINETLRGILRYSTYIRTESETVYFLNESYSGWELSLEAVDGFIFMSFGGGQQTRRVKLLSDQSYAGFSVEDGSFRLTYDVDNRRYTVEYRLIGDAGCTEDVSFCIS